jgi:small subunit ribosomal protein S7
MDVRPDRRRTLALRWLVQNARKRGGRTMIDKLSSEFVDAFNNTGNAVKKKEDTHRMADANKAFSHYRF